MSAIEKDLTPSTLDRETGLLERALDGMVFGSVALDAVEEEF